MRARAGWQILGTREEEVKWTERMRRERRIASAGSLDCWRSASNERYLRGMKRTERSRSGLNGVQGKGRVALESHTQTLRQGRARKTGEECTAAMTCERS